MVLGFGIGLLVAAALVELELMTPQRKAWVAVIGIASSVIGQMIAFRAAGRTRQSEKNEPQKV